jgi:cell division protein FtsI (penicillin-binding protein 3)
MQASAAPSSTREAAEPWRRRLVRTLLYGATVDRAAKAKARIGLAIIAFGVCYAIIAGRLVMYAASDNTTVRRSYAADAVATARPDILDRNGEMLATDVRMPSLFGEPHRIIDKDEAVELLATVIPDLDTAEVRERLSMRRRFVWLRREITAKQRQEIHRLGLPGIGFMHENKRVYPNGALVSHLIGHVNIDNQGIAGIEKWLDSRGLADLHLAGLARDRLQKPVELAVDMRVQHAIRDELVKARTKYKALAAAGLVLDARTGEIVSMVSVPDYDPNNPREALDPTRINRLTTGVYEMGSTFKALTLAMALDSGRMNLNSMFDARVPLQYGKHTINDYRGQKRMLSLPEVFTYSSNIGTARMALNLGVEHHKQFLRRLGQLDRLRTELPESAEPIVPRRWQEINTVTIAFGHGLSVAPLQAMMANAALVNGGMLIPPTFRKRTESEAMEVATRVLKPDTSEKMRYLMRLNAEKGTAKRADVDGFYVGGKTGTSEKVVNGRYVRNKLLNTFTAVFPADQPRYLLLVMLDEPQVIPETHGYATSGWNAAPTAGLIIARIAPLLAITPRFDLPTADRLILASAPTRTTR